MGFRDCKRGSCAIGQPQDLGVNFDPSDTTAYRVVRLIVRQFLSSKAYTWENDNVHVSYLDLPK